MARYTRYRKYSRRFRRKTWSTRIQNIQGYQSASGGSQFVMYHNLTQNPAQTDDSVSLKYTVKNIYVQLEMEATVEADVQRVENLQAYVMFVPQGYVPTGVPGAYADLPFQHPEFILAYRYFGSVQSDNASVAKYPPLRLHSRLARKLDTGDRIIVLILGNNQGTGSASMSYQGLVKYNTKAN